MKITKILNVLHRDDWRKWLEKNHNSKKDIWLVIYKKHSGKEAVTYSEAVEEALCFGWIDGIMKKLDEERFVQRFSPRKLGSSWSLLNKKRVLKMIKEDKMTETGLKLVKYAKETGKWQAAYSSRTKPTLPPDLKKAFQKNKLAYKNFNNFSNSHQFSYIFWILNAKKKETRRKRIVEVIGRSLENLKPV